MNRWSIPRCESRQGASHRRRELPCQDASGWVVAQDRQGRPVTLLAVSDGHGAARHPHSAMGSRLACEIALGEAAQDLRQRDTAELSAEDWRGWLSQDLPEKVVAGWRRAVSDHWTTCLGQSLNSFSPIPYGATLGLLVLTPGGWGHTGLGDWDLLELSVEHGRRIISQEPWLGGDAEATQSLCLEGAGSCFAARSGWQVLPQLAAPFRLLLSSDGLRKSCGSDADFFTLAEFLCELASGEVGEGELETLEPAACVPQAQRQGSPPELLREEMAERCLAAALDRISRQGSGDDISVAIAAWGQACDDQPEAVASGDGGSGLGWGACRLAGPWIVQPPSTGRGEPLGLPARVQRQDRGDAKTQGSLAATGVRPPARAGAEAGPTRTASRASKVWLAAALLGLGVGLLALQRPMARAPFQRPPFQSHPSLRSPTHLAPTSPSPLPPASGSRSGRDSETLPPAQDQSLRRLVAELCGPSSTQRDRPASASLDSRLTELFSARKASFERLRRQPESLAADALAGYANDPLGALIAWSDEAAKAPGVARRRLRRLGACDPLIKVLDQRWRATPGRSGGEVRAESAAAGNPPRASRPRAPSPPSGAPSIAPTAAPTSAPTAAPLVAPSRRLP